jgi:chromosome segregation ATPase
MKKSMVIFACVLAFTSSLNAQSNSSNQNCQQKINELTSERDSMQALFNDVLVRLDSLAGTNIDMVNQLKARKADLSRLKSELDKARKQISDQNIRIEKLERDLKQANSSKGQ